eukprot:COSAG06_NODE_1869_length_8172_cov_3.579143_4_plen_39_part_00
MLPFGSNGAGQAILDVESLGNALAEVRGENASFFRSTF